MLVDKIVASKMLYLGFQCLYSSTRLGILSSIKFFNLVSAACLRG